MGFYSRKFKQQKRSLSDLELNLLLGKDGNCEIKRFTISGNVKKMKSKGGSK